MNEMVFGKMKYETKSALIIIIKFIKLESKIHG